MERKWLWKKKSSEKSSGGETESSGSVSSHSERCSDEQVGSRILTTTKFEFLESLHILFSWHITA